LRTPITALRNFNELLRGFAAKDPDAHDEFLAESAVQIERLEWITSNLLDLSRLDAGLVDLELDRHNVEELLESVRAVFFRQRTRRISRSGFSVQAGRQLCMATGPGSRWLCPMCWTTPSNLRRLADT
jgi:signal transduction histidine kinase